MKKIEKSLFSIEIPEYFDQVVSSKIGIRYNDAKATKVIQEPFISVTVFRIDDTDNDAFVGESLQEKFEDACLSLNYKAEKLKGYKTTFKGLETFTLHAHTDAPWQKTHFKIRYFFAGIVLDDTYLLEFKALHEKNTTDKLEDWVMQVYESLEIIGDTSLRDQVRKQHILDMEKEERKYEEALEDSSENEEAAKKKEFSNVQIPKNGKECFEVGDYDFEFLMEECEIQIAEFSKELLVKLKAKTKQVSKGIKAKLLDDYPRDGMVTLTIPAKGIHVEGEPKGMLYFEEEKTNAPLFLNARSEGFDYSLAFCGSVTFDSGWVLLKGEMTKSYIDKVFPVLIAKKFDMSTLQWQHYRYTSMEEVATANPEDVRFLYLQNPNFIQLPDAIFTFKNLEDLTISSRSNTWPIEKIPFKTIQPEINTLKKLKSLHVSGTSIEKLPEQIGNLKQLEQLNLNNCELKAIPQGVFELFKLKYLWISSNQISQLPENMNLPELTHIHLEKNQLKTLPEALAKQPKLKKIKLEDNPLENLPELFNQVAEIELSMEDKLRLLNYDYNGADGKGLTTWDDSMFWSKNDQELIPEIKNVIKENELEAHGTALLSMVKRAIGFSHLEEEDYTEIGNHRFGGMPDLPENIPYPRFGENWREDKDDNIYEFIGQINCSQIAHLQDYLPRTGTLFFFLETIHNIYGGDNNPGKVIYVENNESLSSGKRFQFTEDDYSEMLGEGYQGFRVDAKKMNSVPSMYASFVNKHLFLGEAETLKDDEKLLEDLGDLFEYPINENTPYEYAVNAYGFTQHENAELQASLAKKGNPQDWVTLLTVTSSGDMQWGDAGDLFFVIHKSDLAKGDFSNIFITMESS
ncbi:MAG: DUF1963 domain-containing protein [Maribacter sp.]